MAFRLLLSFLYSSTAEPCHQSFLLGVGTAQSQDQFEYCNNASYLRPEQQSFLFGVGTASGKDMYEAFVQIQTHLNAFTSDMHRRPSFANQQQKVQGNHAMMVEESTHDDQHIVDYGLVAVCCAFSMWTCGGTRP